MPDVIAERPSSAFPPTIYVGPKSRPKSHDLSRVVFRLSGKNDGKVDVVCPQTMTSLKLLNADIFCENPSLCPELQP